MHAYLFALQGGLTLEKIIVDIPHDAGAVVAYVILGIFIFMIWYGSRRSVIQRYDRGNRTGSDAAAAEGSTAPPAENATRPGGEAPRMVPRSMTEPTREGRSRPATRRVAGRVEEEGR